MNTKYISFNCVLPNGNIVKHTMNWNDAKSFIKTFDMSWILL